MNLKCNSLCLIQADIADHPVHKWLFPLTEEEVTQQSNLLGRVKRIIETSVATNNRVIIDAEQTFLQKYIDILTDQYQYLYNYKSNTKPIVINTIQVLSC